jgi:hypothetical protein
MFGLSGGEEKSALFLRFLDQDMKPMCNGVASGDHPSVPSCRKAALVLFGGLTGIPLKWSSQ